MIKAKPVTPCVLTCMSQEFFFQLISHRYVLFHGCWITFQHQWGTSLSSGVELDAIYDFTGQSIRYNEVFLGSSDVMP